MTAVPDRMRALRAALADIARMTLDADGGTLDAVRDRANLVLAADRAATPDLGVPAVYGVVRPGRWMDWVVLVTRDGGEALLWPLPRGLSDLAADYAGRAVNRLIIDLGLDTEARCGLGGIPQDLADRVVGAALANQAQAASEARHPSRTGIAPVHPIRETPDGHIGYGCTLVPTRDPADARPADPLAPVPGDLWQACTVGVIAATRPIGRRIRLTTPEPLAVEVEGTLTGLDPDPDHRLFYRLTIHDGDPDDAPHALTLPLSHPVEILR